MTRVVLLLLWALGTTLSASAQLAVQLRAEKDVYLLYEPIRVTIGLRNLTGRTLELRGGPNGNWLDFLVTDEASRLITSLGQVSTEDNVLIPPGQTVNRTLDLLPLYNIRERGNFRAQARVRQGAIEALSSPIKFAVVQGRELWKQTVALPPNAQGEQSRTYALLAHRLLKEDMLYVSIQDEPNELLHGMIALGGLVPLSDPETRIDRHGQLHLLFQTTPHAFVYLQIDPYGQIGQRAVYNDKLSRPRLTTRDDQVGVSGGTQTHPRPERVLTEAELAPPPPPPPPPPKKKWWWPFRPQPQPIQEP